MCYYFNSHMEKFVKSEKMPNLLEAKFTKVKCY
jgi:hypothetical protein